MNPNLKKNLFFSLCVCVWGGGGGGGGGGSEFFDKFTKKLNHFLGGGECGWGGN